MANGALRVAVVGCGNISGPYGETLRAYPTIEIAGATDVDRGLSAEFVERFGGIDYPSLEELLGDGHVDAVVNLTSHGVHAKVTAAALEAGKHVHSEKPLAASYAEARSLVELADARGVRLSCSPITFMGEAQEEAWRLLAAGAIGTVRVAYAEVNWGRIETWHPRPEPFYRIGPLADVGVYPLTILTAIFGPARRVTAFGRVVLPERMTTGGEPFSVLAPDFGVAVIELEDGPIVRLTTSFYVTQASKQRGIEFHGDDGSLHLSSWQEFDAALELTLDGEPSRQVPVAPPSAAPTGDAPSRSSAGRSRSGDRIAPRALTRRTWSRSSTRSRPPRPRDGRPRFARPSPALHRRALVGHPPRKMATTADRPSRYRRDMVTKDDVVEALHGVEDPELGMDIVELGLYYDAEIADAGDHVKIMHSLTSMGCPAGQMIQDSIHDAVAALPGVEKVEVELTFDPPWTPDRMSEDAKFILGFG